MGEEGMTEMPKYRSHKEVWALKIEEIEYIEGGDGAAYLHVEHPYAPVKASAHYMRKHEPQPGGYYVQYQDGYESWSPAEAFENGYTRIS